MYLKVYNEGYGPETIFKTISYTEMYTKKNEAIALFGEENVEVSKNNTTRYKVSS